ncbi:MAG: hypothetical protein LM564_01470 [Desulfurococcaceae archaeon]|jgi:hypothetical protein|nr:hypothetical protein [Desulfurococcaceae archaeon]
MPRVKNNTKEEEARSRKAGGEKLKEIIRKLALSEYYLPYATVIDLSRLPSHMLYDEVEKIKRRAIEVLTSDNEEAEIRRQLIFMLSTRTAITGLTPYLMAIIRARALRRPFGSDISHLVYEELELVSKKGWWSKRGYKMAVRTYGDLIQLNFAYTPVERVFDLSLMSWKMPTERKVLISTLQSRALIERQPLKPFESSRVDEDTAEKIVNFGIELRRRVVEGFLKLRPLKAGDIFRYVYGWARKEAEKLKEYQHLIRMLDRSIYEELFVAPYYLYYYNIVNIDPIRYDLFWELT